MPSDSELVQRNPFHVQWVGKYFVGREDEIRIFKHNLSGLKQGEQSHLLVAGVNGTGKSFYLNKLVEIAKDANCIGVVVDCPESTPYEQARSILSATIRELERQRVQIGFPPPTELSSDFTRDDGSQLFKLPKRRDLDPGDLQSDFTFLVDRAKSGRAEGIVVCIDEGQRVARTLLSGLKNALSRVPGILIVLSWRLASDTNGAINQAREELVKRVSDTEGDKDIGAASFFSSQTAMGPFQTDAEVNNYFSARLAGNAIKFTAEVSSRLGEIADRVPRPMTDLAHDVFDAALRAKITNVSPPLLDECFRSRYSRQWKRATDLCADLSDETIVILKSFCKLSYPVSVEDIVKYAFPAAGESSHKIMAQGVRIQLEKLCQSTTMLQKIDDKYVIGDSFSRYALRMVLGLI